MKDYAAKNYPNSKTDMFAMFMETGFVKSNGFTAMINMHSWMFLSSYEKLRVALLSTKEIIALVHLGARAFETIGGEVVQTATFILRHFHIEKLMSEFVRLVEYQTQQEKETAYLNGYNRFYLNQECFYSIPGMPISYWVSDAVRSAYNKGITINKIASPRQGMATTNNNRFLRFWHEVNIGRIGFSYASLDDTNNGAHRWFPYNKGGSYRKWYGNQDYVVNWYKNGRDLKEYTKDAPGGRMNNMEYYFRPSVSWSKVASSDFSTRFFPQGFIFDVAGCSIFGTRLKYLLGFTNSNSAKSLLLAVSQTLNFEVEQIKKLPVIFENESTVDATVENCIGLAKSDWDSFETSWDFLHHPLLLLPRKKADAECTQFAKSRMEKLGSLAWHYERWAEECQDRFNTLKANEEELNRIFIDIYGLQDELTPGVEDKDVTVRLADRERDVKSLVSYLIGVVMGRYSLDVPGLAYAGGDWDATKYKTYQPDDDGIVPIYRGIGMEDGLTAQLINLLKLIYGEDNYRQNIDFIAESIGRNNNESSEEALNRYLNDGFFADHLKIYQKRPIYWLFSSGKNSGFKCLIYMHRYTNDTLARINSRYFLPESTRLKNDLEELVGRLAKAEGRDRVRLEKERQKLAASYNEAIEYGQVLDHMANQYIEIDLDDGVKINYAKFQSVEMVTDSGNKVKKDLLAPIK